MLMSTTSRIGQDMPPIEEFADLIDRVLTVLLTRANGDIDQPSRKVLAVGAQILEALAQEVQQPYKPRPHLPLGQALDVAGYATTPDSVSTAALERQRRLAGGFFAEMATSLQLVMEGPVKPELVHSLIQSFDALGNAIAAVQMDYNANSARPWATT